MKLNSAHEGYEYQDLLTVYFILSEILNGYNSNLIIDCKLNPEDVFDDLTIEREGITLKKQVKYSNAHTLQKKDISAGSSYQLAIDNLYQSWLNNKNKEVRLCLAWNEPTDELVQVLLEKNENKTFSLHQTKIFQINLEELWPNGEEPLSTWRRLKGLASNINRNDFADFCKHLIIETNFPKFSLTLDTPGELESIVLQQADSLGIGIFPNQHISIKNFVARLILKVKEARSKGNIIKTRSIFVSFNIKSDYGSIQQNFPIDKQRNVITKSTVDYLISKIQINKKQILLGEPGSGKSWLVNNLSAAATKKKIHIVKHFCYTDLNDQLQKERIKQNTLYGNLIFDILKEFPELSERKKHKYASTLSELNILVQSIKEPTIIIIDGLDHIDRVYDFNNYIDLTRSDTQIIEILENIECTENVSVLLASQPISKLHKFNGYHTFEIPRWNIKEVKSLLKRHNVNNSVLNKTELSQILLDKSEGNPLYLTYLIKELQKETKIDESFINNLPAYSFNLKEYYNYLLVRLNTRESLPRILSGVNFYLSKDELREITGDGDFIEDALLTLSPILKANLSLNGYIIYHESFRRFILDILKSNNVSIEQNVFKPTIEWFKSKNIFSYTKAFRYGLHFFYNCHQYQEIEQYITKDFIVSSVSWGQPWKPIENNIQIMAQAAVQLRNFSHVIIVNELFKTIGIAESSYESSFISYIECMGMVRGFDHVTNFLTFEGEPALDNLLQGLQACYASSVHKTIAPWNLYFDYFKKGEKIKEEEFKYYVRYYIVQEDTKALVEIAKKIAKRKLIPFEKIFAHEIVTIANPVYKDALLKENLYISGICSKKINSGYKDIDTIINHIKSTKGFTEKEIEIVVEFIEQCEYQNLNNKIITGIIKQLSGINWFYNWLIFNVKVIEIKQKSNYSFYEVKEAFSFLIYDTDPFKGKPRICDLYYFASLIPKTIKKGLALLVKTEDWKEIIDMLIIVNNKTSTTLQGSLGGPLSTDKLFVLFHEIANPLNIDYIITKTVKLYDEEKHYRYFSYLSDYCYIISKLYLKNNQRDDAESYFLLGSRYMVSYTWRRDITLFEAINCLSILPQIDMGLAKDNIKKTYELAESVTLHTDGKDTKWLPIYWFEEYVKIDSLEASLWLMNKLYKTRYSWVLEQNLRDLLKSFQGRINPVLEQFILNSFIVENSDSYINTAVESNEKVTIEDPFLASFFAKKIQVHLQNDRSSTYSDELENKLCAHFSSLNLEYQSIKNPSSKKDKIVLENKQSNYRTNEFSDMTLSEIGGFIKNVNLSESDFHSLIYVFDNIQINDESKQLVQDCIIGKSRYRFDDEIPLEKLDTLFETNKELKIYYNILVFIWMISGNGSVFHLKMKFKEAYLLDSDKSIEYLFELLPLIFNGFNRDFSCNLLTTLAETAYDSDVVIESVMNMMESIEYKIPVVDRKDWTLELENEFNMNQEEILISIILIRSKAYTTERLTNTLSAIAVLLNKEPNKLIKPLKWFFSKSIFFKETVILCVLDILYEYNKNNTTYISNFQIELEKIYPKRYYMIDCLLERFLNKKPYTIILPSQLEVYPLSQNDFEIFLSFNDRLKKLNAIGVDITSVVVKHKTIYLKNNVDNLDLYANRTSKKYVKHIYPSSYILERINTDLYQELRIIQEDSGDDGYEFLRINTMMLIAQNMSFSIRPKDLLQPSQGEKKADQYPIKSFNGWIRIAHYETELKKGLHFDLSEQRSWGSILPGFSNNTSLVLDALYDSENLSWSTNDGVLLEFNQFDPLENYNLFWFNPIIMRQLGISTSNLLHGITAQNENGEVVLKYNQWKSNYVGNGDFGIQEEIPKIEGAELMMREDYFEKLELILKKKISEYTILYLDLKKQLNNEKTDD